MPETMSIRIGTQIETPPLQRRRIDGDAAGVTRGVRTGGLSLAQGWRYKNAKGSRLVLMRG
jgi:hypothetical protein